MQVAHEFEAEGGKVIGISQDLFVPKITKEAALAAVKKMAASRKVPFPTLILDDQTLDGLNDLFALPGPVPCTVALDKDGKEVDRQEGGADLERMRQMMRRALGKEPSAK